MQAKGEAQLCGAKWSTYLAGSELGASVVALPGNSVELRA